MKNKDFDDKLLYSIIDEETKLKEDQAVKYAYASNKAKETNDKWTSIGLLGGIEIEEQRIILSMFYEQTCLVLILTFHKYPKFTHILDDILSITIPVIRRLFLDGKLSEVYIKYSSDYILMGNAITKYAPHQIDHIVNFINGDIVNDYVQLLGLSGMNMKRVDLTSELLDLYCDDFNLTEIYGRQ